jgi:hypothetical protein
MLGDYDDHAETAEAAEISLVCEFSEFRVERRIGRSEMSPKKQAAHRR